jgi:hypothetical protein
MLDLSMGIDCLPLHHNYIRVVRTHWDDRTARIGPGWWDHGVVDPTRPMASDDRPSHYQAPVVTRNVLQY